MSDLKTRLTGDVQAAMRARDRERLVVLRTIMAAIKQKEVDERVEMDDARVLAVLDKLVKQHRDSIEQFGNAGRTDLCDKEKFELGIVQSYLPQAATQQEIADLIESAVRDTGASSIKDMGKVMGRLKPGLQGRADLGQVGALVKDRLSRAG